MACTLKRTNTIPPIVYWDCDCEGGGGVSSIVAGDGITVSGATGDVTVSASFSSITTSSTTITLDDTYHGKLLNLTAGSAVAISVPATLRSDFILTVMQSGAGQATFTGTGGASVANARTSVTTSAQYAMVALTRTPASNTFVLSGDVL